MTTLPSQFSNEKSSSPFSSLLGSSSVGAMLSLMGLIRGRQAWRVLRYQRSMRRLPMYKVRSGNIPLSRRKLFLGRGFRWTQKHI